MYIEQSPQKDISLPRNLRPDLDLAMRWMKDCINHHPECRSNRSHVPPTRILEIIPSKDTQGYDLKLLEKPYPEKPYIALSHCWGKPDKQPLQTTTKNFASYLERISFADLPKSFQDATIAAASLGIVRLWIDSLCIIQDDLLDW